MSANNTQPPDLELARRIVHAKEHRRFRWQAAVSGPGSSGVGAGDPADWAPAPQPTSTLNQPKGTP